EQNGHLTAFRHSDKFLDAFCRMLDFAKAYGAFYACLSRYPKFKRKGNRIYLPKIGLVSVDQ
ncbi:MAG: hypothetical protein QXO68_00495, partial [Conexivisphaerales archaeon]